MTPQSNSLTFRASSILPALFLLPLSLDYKGAVQGGLWQITLFAVSLAAGATYLLVRKVPRPQGRSWQWSSLAVLVTLGGAGVTSFLNGIPLSSFGRLTAPIVLFALAYFIGAAMTHYCRGELLVRLLRWGCAISVVFTVFTGFSVSGVNAESIRYQILSPVLLMYQALLLHQLVIDKENRLRASGLLLGCVALQLLSVTRSSVLAVMLLSIAMVWMVTPTMKRFIKSTVKGLLAAAALGVAAFLVVQAVSPQVGDRWSSRLGAFQEHEIDPTSLSRIAEMSDQLRLWRESPETMLIGRGYGASYGWSQAYDMQLLETGAFNLEGIDLKSSDAGHSFWVSSLFSGGLMFGLILPSLLLWSSWRGMILSRRLIRLRFQDSSARFVSLATIMLVASLTTTIGGNPFGTRYAGLVIGAGLGMLVASRRQVAMGELSVRNKSALQRGQVYADRLAGSQP